ncbi:AsnC family transcriptional regulator [Epibacterium sp. SM1969]|uniref:AsnC family transcriptional regulator n=1 Tax=Tritonibacter aquimaris TaxID=2663379 RepID=A0A844ALR1_9RHOB|nr:Lrp/AsnC family transcriptional regulator [Tritonibacter aquimaris]MQY42915.1 AsnC family transcriptional regulator [Tritonibacter aquimaris]
MQIDATDQQLMALLRDNARQSVAELARQLDLARTTVQARLERLEASGAIAGYTLRVSPLMRAPLQATVLISVEPRAAPGVLDRLRSLAGVQVVHTTSGRFDLLAQVEAQTTEELDNTIDHIAGARGVRSSESLIHLATKLDRMGA